MRLRQQLFLVVENSQRFKQFFSSLKQKHTEFNVYRKNISFAEHYQVVSNLSDILQVFLTFCYIFI